MPYRAELKRPDLKGQFPCSVCGKIFCHSSSLSRHRMQAHFKSYTCTQCNQEISSNETLRSHMFRIHSISRMFMCRCCNWAFPDKTSLHIHMQSMLRNGHPGDVSVLARSSTEDGPVTGILDDSPSSSPHSGSPPRETPIKINNNNNNNTTNKNNNNNNIINGSIFPTLTNLGAMRGRENGLSGVPPELAAAAQNHWLAAWLANNPFASPLHLAGVQAQLLSNNESLDLTKEEPKKEPKVDVEENDEDDALEINTCDDSDLKDDKSPAKSSPAGSRLDSFLFTKRVEPEGSHRKNRKAANPKKDGEPPAKVSALSTEAVCVNGDANGGNSGATSSSEQPSPAVSDSHTSASSAQRSIDSPVKCFDCTAAKAKLQMSDNKIRALEAKAGQLELHQGRIEGRLADCENQCKEHIKEKAQLKILYDSAESRLRECQERCVAALAILGNGAECLPAVRLILENLAECAGRVI